MTFGHVSQEPTAASRRPWTSEEVEQTVADYFHMLRLELSGQRYSKTEHRRELKERVDQRSDGAIEMKHQNISAVLLELGVMPLRGYKALNNYQRQLFEAVERQLGADKLLDRAALFAVEQPAETPSQFAFDEFLTPRPPPQPSRVNDIRRQWLDKTSVKRDYLEREARNRALGLAGELLVLEYEAQRLHAMGQKHLADRVEHVAAVRGDGCGYDVLSFDGDGRERYIEVKTTAFAAEAPFFISQNEVAFSEDHSDQFHLYRLFEFRQKPRMFSLLGAVSASCHLDPRTYRATVA